MNNKTLLTAFIALVVGATGGYVIAQIYETTPIVTNQKDSAVFTDMHRMPDGSLMGNGNTNSGIGMMNGIGHSMMTVSSEKEFITKMIPHHEEAVLTAKEVLARGATTPEIKTLVEGIVTAQEKEIADMKIWYQAWYGTPYTPSGTYQPMMRDLTQLSRIALDQAFLEDMIMHHMGAIMMAHSVQGYIEHSEITNLTKAIIDSQSDEIQLMRKLRTELE